MGLPLIVSRKMLEIEKINYRRQCCSFANVATTAVLFVFIAAAQAGLLDNLGSSVANIWILVEYIFLLLSLISLACGTILVFHIEREKKKIHDMIVQDARKNGFSSRIAAEKENRSGIDRISDFIENHSNKLDLFATLCFVFPQLLTCVLMFAFGGDKLNNYTVGPLKMGWFHVFDIVNNAAGFISISLFCISHRIVHRKAKSMTKELASATNTLLTLFAGSTLLLSGKIFCALESVDIVHSPVISGSATFPIGWIMRVVGLGLVLFGIGVMLYGTDKKCTELRRLVEGGEGTQERLAALSTHEVRSCFGYMEHGIR